MKVWWMKSKHFLTQETKSCTEKPAQGDPIWKSYTKKAQEHKRHIWDFEDVCFFYGGIKMCTQHMNSPLAF